ncbi:DUF2066 domain-containing protein [Marilutibacter spongiae]|uniref:DUF2066 domain-containing protein n=1 Tax=Marilutibacter spongiae TaxID=2025720 RepID=A0A7W3Y595_9GAMM|nr:DUF2066 domain-containing protein [Lysobacter spongiae]MBB1060253.1 DUF2066 domain-containing protein [Lysobacter spongiae]
MSGAIRTAFLSITAAMLLACLAPVAQAQRVEGDRARAEDIYTAEVAVRGQAEGERKAAFARGLAQVLGKLSGDRQAASAPGVGRELRRAEDYVVHYDYRQDETVTSSGAPTYRTMLVVQYQDTAVDALAATLGIPVWPQPRPKPVLWLAIDDGSGPRLVGLSKSAVARTVLDRAIQRGYRLGLPTGNAAEQAVVGAIWRGDTAAVARASQRYNPPMQLVGKLYRDGGGWTADWIFVDRGRVLARWSESGADARQVMATGADGAADALTKRYAKRSAVGPAGSYAVTFEGLDSADDYIRLSGYLQGLAVVRGIKPLKATADSVVLKLELLTGLAGLKRMADGDDVLVPVESLAMPDGLPEPLPEPGPVLPEDDTLDEPPVSAPSVYRVR